MLQQAEGNTYLQPDLQPLSLNQQETREHPTAGQSSPLCIIATPLGVA